MKTIAEVCEANWAAHQSDCSGFVKAVAADLGIRLTGQANSIIDAIGRSPWEDLGTDAKKAVLRAGSRHLVIGGLKASPNGHVVVIVPGGANPWPHAYWGRLGGVGRRNATINWSWNAADRARVKYYALSIPTPIAVQ